MRDLLAGLLAAHQKALPSAAKGGRVIDFVRSEYPGLRHRPGGASDLDFLQHHYQLAARQVREHDRADDHGKKEAMRMLVAHAKAALAEIGHDPEDAATLANEWAGVREGVPA